MYIKQKNADVVVIQNGEQALLEHPELFESIEGDPPTEYDNLIYST